MSEGEANGGAEAREPGVFGKLPRTRPGVRSSLRAGESAEAERSPEPTPEPEARRETAQAQSPPPPPRREPEPEPEPEPAAEGQGGGLEDLAWAGITVAAEAATLGVRIASRALEAVREAVERR